MILESWGHTVGLVIVSARRTSSVGALHPTRLWPRQAWCACAPAGRRPWLNLAPLSSRPPALHPPCPLPLQIMDTPRPDQVRPAQPQALEPTDEDCLELMEMILGALGAWGRCLVALLH